MAQTDGRRETAGATSPIPEPSVRWWGEFEIAVGQFGFWRIGTLQLWIERLPREWRISELRSEAHGEDDCQVQCPFEGEGPPSHAEMSRYATGRSGGLIVLSPATADRSIVSRPDTPLHLLARDQVELYVGTPLWVRVRTADAATLLETPTTRPSDTWFGLNTREGELSYASRTRARLRLENLPARGHRAITRVDLVNRADDALLIERINLPVAELALFRDEAGRYWTPHVRVERDTSGVLAEVRIGSKPPPEAGSVERVSDPRDPGHQNVLVRALSHLLG